MSSVIRLNDPEDKSAKSRAFRKQFADNLNAALDRKGAIPSGYGRVIGVAELFGVSQNTAANWLKGEGVPELARLPEIAGILGTTVEQLVMGDQHVGTHVIDERYVMVDMHGDDSPEAHAWYTLPEALRSMGLPTSIKMLAVGDDDMAPFLHRGDLAIYDPRVRRIQSNGVFVLCVNDRFLVRRVQRRERSVLAAYTHDVPTHIGVGVAGVGGLLRTHTSTASNAIGNLPGVSVCAGNRENVSGLCVE